MCNDVMDTMKLCLNFSVSLSADTTWALVDIEEGGMSVSVALWV